jgi:hypothetical protein
MPLNCVCWNSNPITTSITTSNPHTKRFLVYPWTHPLKTFSRPFANWPYRNIPISATKPTRLLSFIASPRPRTLWRRQESACTMTSCWQGNPTRTESSDDSLKHKYSIEVCVDPTLWMETCFAMDIICLSRNTYPGIDSLISNIE